ncbi:MAG: hypothetical protein K8I00_10695, partial [Candidatus Omnitrophica bacterium]|nr:hypothetical protein [Candidatus Omnitrophota bacterium]
MNVSVYFQLMVKKEASDLYLRTKAKPRARINGKVDVISDHEITRDEMEQIVTILLANDERRKQYKEELDIDFIHE